VALVINDLSNPFFAEFAAGVDEALGAEGFVTLLGSTNESPERQQAVLDSLLEHGPAGIILSPAEHSDGEAVRRLIGITPALVFNRALAGGDWDFLALENERGARLATEHLLSLGHRRIAFFGGHGDSSSCRQRRQGYIAALSAAGIAPDPNWLVECTPTRVAAAHATHTLFERDRSLTAAVCYNDNVALGLMLGLQARGTRPGVDFAITGFDDIPEAALSTPPLTTLSVDPRARGRQAAELLLQRVRSPDAAPCNLVAPVKLVVRGSSGGSSTPTFPNKDPA
jgi:LacI family transcriptional regulator